LIFNRDWKTAVWEKKSGREVRMKDKRMNEMGHRVMDNTMV